MADNFTPYRDRPALDKGAKISWTELESGMLFNPGVGAPSIRRVRGVPNFIWYGDRRSPSYMIGTEDAADGRPCGGVIGCADEFFIRTFLDDGRPFYRSDFGSSFDSDEETIERLRVEFTAKLAEVEALAADVNLDEDLSLAQRLRIAKENLEKLDERDERP